MSICSAYKPNLVFYTASTCVGKFIVTLALDVGPLGPRKVRRRVAQRHTGATNHTHSTYSLVFKWQKVLACLWIFILRLQFTTVRHLQNNMYLKSLHFPSGMIKVAIHPSIYIWASDCHRKETANGSLFLSLRRNKQKWLLTKLKRISDCPAAEHNRFKAKAAGLVFAETIILHCLWFSSREILQI